MALLAVADWGVADKEWDGYHCETEPLVPYFKFEHKGVADTRRLREDRLEEAVLG